MTQHPEHGASYLDKIQYDPSLEKSWFSVFLDRSRLLTMVIAIIIIAGLLSLRSLPLESNPEVNIGMAMVSVAMPGASPETMEDQVIKRLEKNIAKVKGIDTMTATARNSVAVISVQFLSNVNSSEALRDLRDQVDTAKSSLPADAKDPVVKEVSFSDTPVWTFSIAGDYDGFKLYSFAKKIRDELERDPQVSEVTIAGGDETEFTASLEPAKLERYGLTVSAVNSAIAAANVALPVGDQKVGDYVHKITVDGRYFSARDLADIAVARSGTLGVVRLGDLGKVEETAAKRTTLSRLSAKGASAQPAVSLGVLKRKGGSIVDLVDKGTKTIASLRESGAIPHDLKLVTILDQSERIKLDLHHLVRDGILTFVLVFLTLLFLTGLRPALVAAATVPLVFMVTFTVMSLSGQTLNFLSMFALILSLGLLVDDAIVVVTAINQYLKTGKFTAKQAALLVLRDYKRVLTSTTLTVVWVFSAMLFMTGIIGKFIFSIPFVVTVTLLASLFVALTINPAMSVILERRHDGKRVAGGRASLAHKGFWAKVADHGVVNFSRVESWYAWLLSRLIADRRTAWRFVGMVTALFLVSLALPVTGLLKSDFFPATDQDTIYVNVELDPGVRLDVTSDKVRKVEEILLKEKEIDSFAVTIGQPVATGRSLGGSTSGEHYAGISINLLKKEYGRKETSMSIAERLRKELAAYPELRATVDELKSGPPAGDDFELKVAGDDFRVLESVAQDVRSMLAKVPGAINIQTSRKPLPIEFRFSFDPAKLALYDLTLPQVASFLRNAVDGAEATKVYKGKDEIVVRTRYADDSVATLGAIKNLKATNQKGQQVFVRDVLTNDLESSVSSITRVDQRRVVTVSAAAAKGYTGKQLLAGYDKLASGYKLPAGYEFIVGGSNDENAKSVQSLFVAMLFGVLLIISTLVVLYDSFKQALIVLVTIPFSLIGVFWGLVLFGQPLSFPGMIGVVALFGLVVRNGIIFFDKINQNRAEGFTVKESIIDAGSNRLEPEVLTSLCTILGMIPLTFSNPMWTSLGLAIMFGLLSSTLLTLRVLPCLYYLLIREDEKPMA